MKFRLSWFFLLLNFLLNSVRKSLNSFQLFFFCSKRVIKVAFSDMFFWLTSFWFSKNIDFLRLPHCLKIQKGGKKWRELNPALGDLQDLMWLVSLTAPDSINFYRKMWLDIETCLLILITFYTHLFTAISLIRCFEDIFRILGRKLLNVPTER